jgi:hypothetical protein
MFCSKEGWKGLVDEIEMEVERISERNLGRDDRYRRFTFTVDYLIDKNILIGLREYFSEFSY